MKNHEQTQDDRSGDGKPLMNQHILSSKRFTNGRHGARRSGTFAVAPGKSGCQERESPAHISGAVRGVTCAPAWIGRSPM